MWGLILVVFFSTLAALAWALYNHQQLKKISTNQHLNIDQELHEIQQKNTITVTEITTLIRDAILSYLINQYKMCTIAASITTAIIWICADKMNSPYTSFAYILGTVTSMACGAFTLYMTTFTNIRTVLSAQTSLNHTFKCTYRAGVVIGFASVSVSLLMLFLLVQYYLKLLGLDLESNNQTYFIFLFQTITGFGLGGSTVALFGRVGGGIFDKSSELGSEMVGKVESTLQDNILSNPVIISNYMGDHVGDATGMSLDLLDSFTCTLCAAMAIGAYSIRDFQGVTKIELNLFVLVIPALGLLVNLVVSALLLEGEEITQNSMGQNILKKQLMLSALALLPIFFIISKVYLYNFKLSINKIVYETSGGSAFLCLALGLTGGLAIAYVTEIMVNLQYKPVQQLAESSRTGSISNVVQGFILGYLSNIIPITTLCLISYFCHLTLGYYGVALGALGMLSNLPICLTITTGGSINSNAIRIAEISEVSSVARKRIDFLNNLKSTTSAISQSLTVGSATLSGFALFGTFMHNSLQFGLILEDLTFDSPLIVTTLLFGATIPYIFAALVIRSAGKASLQTIAEARKQIQQNFGISDGSAQPDYYACVAKNTEASLKEMLIPGLLITCLPLILGFCWGPKALIGFLPGAIVSGVQLGISHSNSGSAWENAKKYIEDGLMKDYGEATLKGSQAHKSATIGSQVGSFLKKTSSPSLNILIKLMAMQSLVFCQFFSG